MTCRPFARGAFVEHLQRLVQPAREVELQLIDAKVCNLVPFALRIADDVGCRRQVESGPQRGRDCRVHRCHSQKQAEGVHRQ